MAAPVPSSAPSTEGSAAENKRRTPLAAFRSHDFRLLWFGQFVSQIGSQMTVVAISWQLYELTGSKWSLGLIGLFRIIPLLIFSLGSGVLADALDRRKLMMVSQFCLALLVLFLAIMTNRGLATPALIYAVITLHSTAATFDLPARQALIPNLVPPADLANALSLNTLAWQTATVIGPSLGGILIGWRHTVDAVYAIDAVSYGAVLVSLLLMRVRHVKGDSRRAVSLRSAVEGLRFVRHQPILWWSMTLDFIATFFAGAMTLLPVFARDILAVGPQGLGLLYAAPSIGAVVAGVVMSWLGSFRRQGLTLFVSVAVYGLCTVMFGVSRSFILSVVMLAGLGGADTVSMIIRNTIRQLVTPDGLRGRMVSVNQIFFVGGPQLGEIEAGGVAQLLGAPAAVWTGGLLCILAVAFIAVRAPNLRRYESDLQST